MRKSYLFIALTVLLTQVIVAQTNTIANYDFNSASSYPIMPTTTASGISCSGTSTELFQTFSGVVTTPVAFVQNSTAGNAIAMSNSSGSNTHNFVFQLGGSDLINYQSYKMYLQPQRSTTGATLITVAYSTNGSSYTNLSNTYPVTTTYSDMLIDLSSATSINNTSAVYIKLMVSGASSSSGTIRLDNIQIQATRSTTGGGTSYPWVINGNNIGFTGNVGVGTPNPLYNLDVIGDARIGNNLIVGGGILISQKVQATSSMKTDTVHSVTGQTNFTSKVVLKQQFQVDGSTLFNGTVQAGNLNVSGNSNFANGANVNGLLNTNNLNVSGTMSLNNAAISGNLFTNTLRLGNAINYLDVKNYQINATTSFLGLGIDSVSATNFRTASANSSSPFYCSQNLNGGTVVKELTVLAPMTGLYENHLSIQTDKMDGYISLVHPTTFASTSTPGVLRINETCVGNVNIAKGGGYVSTGHHLEIGNPTRDDYTALNISLTTYQTNAIQIYDPTTNKINFKVKSNGYVYAREINVMPTTITFPDYVFAKNYKLMPLAEVENYVTANKHLPNIPSAKEVETNGINVADLQIKQMEKIEELYLHLIELKKENEALKTRVESLEKK